MFEEVADDIFRRILVPVNDVLKKAELSTSDVDDIVLVGGSTRIPRVRQLLGDLFNMIPNTSIEPELAVAIGTALHAAVIADSWPLPVAAIEKPFAQ